MRTPRASGRLAALWVAGQGQARLIRITAALVAARAAALFYRLPSQSAQQAFPTYKGRGSDRSVPDSASPFQGLSRTYCGPKAALLRRLPWALLPRPVGAQRAHQLRLGRLLYSRLRLHFTTAPFHPASHCVVSRSTNSLFAGSSAMFVFSCGSVSWSYSSTASTLDASSRSTQRVNR